VLGAPAWSPAKCDRYLYDDDRAAMSDQALRGMKLFFSDRLRCGECHNSFNLSEPVAYEGAPDTQNLFHNNGLYNVDGRGSYFDSDRGLFRPDPSCREGSRPSI